MNEKQTKEPMEIKIVSYDELPPEIEKCGLSNNGTGKGYSAYLLWYYNGKLQNYESDAMEPEDCSFSRDLSWIREWMLKAYEMGRQEVLDQI